MESAIIPTTRPTLTRRPSAAVRELVLGTPVVLRWFQRSLGALLIGLAASLALTDR